MRQRQSLPVDADEPARDALRPAPHGDGPQPILRRVPPHSTKTSWWRWRESNPRPMTGNQGFSGRILHLIFSAPTITQTSRGRAQSPKSPRSPDDEGYEQWLSR